MKNWTIWAALFVSVGACAGLRDLTPTERASAYNTAQRTTCQAYGLDRALGRVPPVARMAAACELGAAGAGGAP